MYKEAGWTQLGRTKGYARANGRYTDPHGVPKDLHVFPLHRDSRSRLCAPDPLPDPLLPNPMGDASGQPPHGFTLSMRSFYECRISAALRAASTLSNRSWQSSFVARLAGFETGIGAAQFARALNQTELKPRSVRGSIRRRNGTNRRRSQSYTGFLRSSFFGGD